MPWSTGNRFHQLPPRTSHSSGICQADEWYAALTPLAVANGMRTRNICATVQDLLWGRQGCSLLPQVTVRQFVGFRCVVGPCPCILGKQSDAKPNSCPFGGCLVSAEHVDCPSIDHFISETRHWQCILAGDRPGHASAQGGLKPSIWQERCELSDILSPDEYARWPFTWSVLQN